MNLQLPPAAGVKTMLSGLDGGKNPEVCMHGSNGDPLLQGDQVSTMRANVGSIEMPNVRENMFHKSVQSITTVLECVAYRS